MSPFCLALSKPEDWQTLARGGGKASAGGGGFAQTQGLHTRCIQGEETPILKAAVPARSQGLGSINQSAGVIFRQEPEPSKQCKASRQLWAWRRAVNSKALHFPLRAGSEGACPDQCPTPRALGPRSPSNAALAHRNLRMGRLSALEGWPVKRGRGVPGSTPPPLTLVL